MSATPLLLPLPPNRANRRGHWSHGWEADQYWLKRASVWLQNQRAQRPAQPLALYEIVALVVTQRPSDLDNATARLKPALDLLVKRGWLAGDGPHQLRRLTVSNVVNWKEPRLELTITPVEGP